VQLPTSSFRTVKCNNKPQRETGALEINQMALKEIHWQGA